MNKDKEETISFTGPTHFPDEIYQGHVDFIYKHKWSMILLALLLLIIAQ